jgi:predicted DNA-binding WGR domain protein
VLGVPHQALMHKTEPTGDVKFYKMQLLESDDGDEYRLFRRYGVVLTDTTKDNVHEFNDLEDAVKEFKKYVACLSKLS